jgi:hypothetical protein
VGLDGRRLDRGLGLRSRSRKTLDRHDDDRCEAGE